MILVTIGNCSGLYIIEPHRQAFQRVSVRLSIFILLVASRVVTVAGNRRMEVKDLRRVGTVDGRPVQIDTIAAVENYS